MKWQVLLYQSGMNIERIEGEGAKRSGLSKIKLTVIFKIAMKSKKNLFQINNF